MPRLLFASPVLLAGLALSGVPTPAVFAASFTVNTHSDTHDVNQGDGKCADANGTCSLRAAIEESNHLPGFPPTLITLPPGTYKLSAKEGGLKIMHSLDLNGDRSDTTFIDGNAASRVFEILGDSNPIVHFSGITVQNGFGIFFGTDGGAGILIRPGASLGLSNSAVKSNKSSQLGGGINAGGELEISTSTIAENCSSNFVTATTPCNETRFATAGGGGQTESAGGIMIPTGANVKIDRSTISGNMATRGGGIRNAGGHLEITNSTISGNTAFTRGGGVMNFGTAFIAYSTIAFNEANACQRSGVQCQGGISEPSLGGGIYNDPGTGTAGETAVVDMGNTILAMNTDNRSQFDRDYTPDCYSVTPATLTSFRGNLVGKFNANCNLSDTIFGDTRFDQVGTPADFHTEPFTPEVPIDPQLERLSASSGGLTATHALRSDSPAIDHGTGVTSATFFNCPATDQRDGTRPIGMACDVGAFEFGSRADVTTDMRITSSSVRFNPTTGHFTQQITVQNLTGNPISGPLALVLDNLDKNATLINKTGDADIDSPYITLSNDGLVSGGRVTVGLEFTNNNARITYNTRVLATLGAVE